MLVSSRHMQHCQGRSWVFVAGGPDFRGQGRGTEVPSGVPGQSPGGGLGQPAKPPKQNLYYRFMKRRKAVYRKYAAHMHALIFPACVTHFKRK